MKNSIFKISMIAMLCIAMNTTKAQLVAPTGTDILWVISGLTGINTALINIIDSSTDNMNYPYKQLGACAYDGPSSGGGGVVVTDFRSGCQVNTTYLAGGFSGNHMASVPDVIIGNKSGSTMDFIMAVAFVNDAGQIEVDYFDITYISFFVFTVNYNSSDLINPAGGGFYTPAGTVHIDVVAKSSSLTPYGLPYCNTFFLTWDEMELITPSPHLVFTSYGNLNGYTALTAGPQQINMITCFNIETWQPDVAGVEREVSPGTFHDVACLTYVLAGNPFSPPCNFNYWLYYSEWEPASTGPLCGGKLINYAPLSGNNYVPPLPETCFVWLPDYQKPRIDANDDYNTNGGVSACQAKVVAEAFNEFPTWASVGTYDVGIYNPGATGGISTTPWIDIFALASGYPFGGYGAYNHYAPHVAYGQGWGSEYMVTECINESTLGDFFMMSPVGNACGSGLSGTNFYEVNSTFPATSSNYANAVSTPVNMTWDTSLVAWTHNNRIYYKRSGPAYAYKPAANNTPMDKASISIWPNPAEGQLTISNPDNTANSYAIKNLLGQTMINGSMKSGDQTIDISSLITGNYFINFSKDGVPSGNRRFIKK